MSTSSSDFSLPPELIAQASQITSCEVEQLKMMNRVLVEKLMQVEGELKRLKENGIGEERVMEQRSSTTFSQDFEPRLPSTSSSKQRRSELRPTQPQPSTTLPILTTTPLPDYHPSLPPIDRTILHEEFYADLQDKRIIPGYDEERYSCWCHVSKSAKGSTAPLSIQHLGGTNKPFRVSRWFQHAAKCAFFKDPWATDEHGERLFPQFPLANPSQALDEERHSAPANSPLHNSSPVEPTTTATPPRIKTPTTYYKIPNYSAHLPAIDQTLTGKDFFTHLRDAKLIARLEEKRYACWCHLAKDFEKRLPEGHSKSHADGGFVDGIQGGRYRVSKFFEHAKSCKFFKNPWATDETGRPLFPQFPLPDPEPASRAIERSERKETPSSTTATQELTTSSNPAAAITHYSPFLPPIDTGLASEEFFAHLRNESIIASYDATRFSCWCHISRDIEKGMTTGSHGKSHASANGRFIVSTFYEHARKCSFFTDPWATSSDGDRLFPHFPLEKPARPDTEDAVPESGRSLRKRKKVRDSSLLLLVPASSPKFLKSSLASPAQTIIYDLEDSVHASAKASAREALIGWLAQIPAEGIQGRGLNGLSLAVRPNSPFTAADAEDDGERGNDDVYETLREKSERGRDDESVADIMQVWGSAGARRINDAHPKTRLIASIESPESLLNIGAIAGWRGRGVELVGLTFAAEDFCASSHILRSPARTELLFARSSIVTAARTFGLAAIDMVCVDYKDLNVLKEEAEEGRRLGFDGKQAIHPSQVETIRKAFAPSEAELYRASLILHKMATSSRGAEGVKGKDGKEEMIDKPMVLQARRIVKEAKAAGIEIPDAQ
ncbi:hypothetical protein NCC49_001071 [Naganishia albida]|nr:hypothetical protein NCC49_001071 [Naganishia albida]